MKRQIVLTAALAVSWAVAPFADAGRVRSIGRTAGRGGAMARPFSPPARTLPRAPVGSFNRPSLGPSSRRPPGSFGRPPRGPSNRPPLARPFPAPGPKAPPIGGLSPRPGAKLPPLAPIKTFPGGKFDAPDKPDKPPVKKPPIFKPGPEIIKKIKAAGPLPIKGGGKPGFKPPKDYHLKHAVKHAFGYCFHGAHHCHWSHSCWWEPCGCYLYWCPCTCVWYYWCEPHVCFYPVTYCPLACYVCWW